MRSDSMCKVKVSRYCKLSCIVTILMALFILSPISAHAETTNTSLKLICKTDSVVLSNMEWSIYKVSSSKFEGYYMLDGDFASYPVSLEDIYETSKMLDVANTLRNYTIVDSIQAVSKGATNTNGEVSFADLEVGLYLVSGDPVTIDDKKYTPSPMLVEVTEYHETAFQLTSYPKFTVKTLLDQDVTYSVEKLWLNEKDATSRPKDVILHLYKDGEFFREITLNDSNDWKYTWVDKDIYDWNFKEVQIPEGYIVVYANGETQYLAINTYDLSTYNRMVSFSISNVVSASNSVTTTDTDSTNPDVTNVSGIGSGTTIPSSGSDNTNNSNVSTPINGISSSSSDVVVNTGSGNTTSTVSTTDTNVVGGGLVTTTVNDTTNFDKSNGGNSANNNNNNSGTNSMDRLPQTGQVWLPVPILIICGIVCISIGLRIDSKQ
jgi:hypothetical protein